MTTYRFLFVLFALTFSARSAEAGSVTYNFIMSNVNPGAIAATLTFSSPASSNGMWSTANPNIELVSFRVLNAFIAPVGLYTSTIESEVISNTGAGLNGGTIAGTRGVTMVTAAVGSGPFQSVLTSSQRGGTAAGHSLNGRWVVVNAVVPEPSSLILAGTAALTGLGLWSRRRLQF